MQKQPVPGKSKNSLRNFKDQKAFEVLKARLTSAPNLAFPSLKGAFFLYTDASQHAMDAVLGQVENGSERVICHAFKCFSKTQSRSSTKKR